jgi:hypothetical protein
MLRGLVQMNIQTEPDGPLNPQKLVLPAPVEVVGAGMIGWFVAETGSSWKPHD